MVFCESEGDVGLTPQQRTDFETKGWIVLGAVFEEAELEEIRGEYDRILENSMSIGEKGKIPFSYSPLLHLQSPTMCRYACDRRLIEVAMELVAPDIRLYWDQAVNKPAGATSDVPWHQDNGYTPVLPDEYLTFTIALDAATEENGCLWIQPGSHRHGVARHTPTDMLFFRGYEGDDPGVPVPQADGEVLCFSSLTMHRTGPNETQGQRRSWVVQHCDAATRHRETGELFDDRLLLSRNGEILEPPERHRPFDLSKLVKAANKAR